VAGSHAILARGGRGAIALARTTYQAVFVGNVVGELELVKGDHFLHPVLARGWTVGVDVHALGHLGVSLARHDPSTATQEKRRLRTKGVLLADEWWKFHSSSRRGGISVTQSGVGAREKDLFWGSAMLTPAKL